MSVFKRYLTKQVKKDLLGKMVFIGGPRQVGKTTLAKHLLGAQKEGYLNWDIAEHRERILKRQWPTGLLWVFDELHKYRAWRNVLKGLYDQWHERVKILVTGSARLDLYRRGGDSLQGRYHYFHLHPLSVAELKIKTDKEFKNLLELGGFPEPFFKGDFTQAKRWSREYRTHLIQDEINSLEHVIDLGNLELLMLRLPDLVGSPLSINALREDLQVSHKTVATWLRILERLYAIFRLSPFGAAKIQAVKKEQKHYHFDWSLVEDRALRFENMVAAHLLKWVHFQQDTKGEDIELRYFRDVKGREIDFVIVKKREPIMAIETKWSDTDISLPLKYFKQRFPQCETWQISFEGKKDYFTGEAIRVVPALTFLRNFI